MSLWLLGVAGIIVIIIVVTYASQPSAKDFDFQANVKAIIHSFDTGDLIIFDRIIESPVTEFIYVEKQVTETVTLENGTQINQTKTVLEKVDTTESLVTVSAQDRQTGDTLICRLGHQCDVTGKITLIDPTTNKEIQPPYGFFIQIECINADHQMMNCNNFNTISVSERTFPDSTFKYTFTTNSAKNPPGDYLATVVITSKFKVNNKFIEETGTREIKIVE